jgi:plasmid stability protein
MEQIIISDINSELAMRLEQQARLHNVSVDEEAKTILMKQLVSPRLDPNAFLDRVRKLRNSQPLVTFDIDAAIDEGRE